MKKLFFIMAMVAATLAGYGQQTGQEVKDQIDTDITNKTGAGSITKTAVGNNMKNIVDYVDDRFNNYEPPTPQTPTLQQVVSAGTPVITNGSGNRVFLNEYGITSFDDNAGKNAEYRANDILFYTNGGYHAALRPPVSLSSTITLTLPSTSGNITTAEAVTTAIAGKANLASPNFTGTPQAPTPATTESGNRIATCSFVQAVAQKSEVYSGTTAYTESDLTTFFPDAPDGYMVIAPAVTPPVIYLHSTGDNWHTISITNM